MNFSISNSSNREDMDACVNGANLDLVEEEFLQLRLIAVVPTIRTHRKR